MTTNDTVNAALREIAKRPRRVNAVAGLAELAEAGAFDELVDKAASHVAPPGSYVDASALVGFSAA